MQHNPSKDTKPDPPGPEYLLMTSVCPVTGGMQGMGAGDSERRMGFFFFFSCAFLFQSKWESESTSSIRVFRMVLHGACLYPKARN